MADNLNNALMGAGIAAGALEAPFYNARLREANNRAEMSKLQLQDYKDQAPVRQSEQDLKLAKLESDLYTIQAAMAKQQSYDAFTRFRADGDAKHLNQWLEQNRTNPVAQNITSDMARMDRLTRTPDNDKMLQAAGITDLDGFYAHPDVNSSYMVGTTTSGNKALIDMNRMYAVTGFTKQMTDESLKKLSTTAALLEGLRKGGNMRGLQADSALVQQIAATTGQTVQDVYTMLQPDPVAGLDYTPKTATGSGMGRGTALERVVRQLMQEDPEMTLREAYSQGIEITTGGGRSNEARFVSEYMNNNPSSTRADAVAEYRKAGRDERTGVMKNIEFTEQAKNDLDTEFGGDFLNADISNLDSKKIRALDRNLTRIEQAGGLALSSEEKKNARDIMKLLNTADYTAKNLSDAQTGIIDSSLNQVKTYINNEVSGKQATVAYNTLGAFYRDALFGKQVSAADRKDMAKVQATLGQQTGPVLASLRQQLVVTRDELAAASALGDPYVAKARYGMSIDKLDGTITSLNNRISLLDKGISGTGVGATNSGVKVRVTSQQPGGTGNGNPIIKGDRPSLSSIFGGE
ncbi:hypothetical protein [Dickeya phage Amaethon]|nr:hypothetical protein [Dickeya phage Amaethon]